MTRSLAHGAKPEATVETRPLYAVSNETITETIMSNEANQTQRPADPGGLTQPSATQSSIASVKAGRELTP